MKSHKIVLLGIIGFLPVLLKAQVKQEVGVSLGGGLSSLNYKKVSTDFSDRLGFSGSFSYMYFLTNNWAIKSGLELSYYHSKSDVRNMDGSVDAIDDEKEAFKYQYSIGGYEETQNTYLLNIPIMGSFQTDRPNSITNFYASAGVKVGIPVSSRYKSSMSSIAAKGYYPNTNVTIDDFINRGFGSFTDIKNKGNIKTNMQVLASVEAGIKNKIVDNLFIYSGLYFDYGLNNLAKKNKTLIEYNTDSPKDIHNNSMLNSKFTDSDNNKVSLVNKVHPIAFGIKLSLAFEL